MLSGASSNLTPRFVTTLKFNKRNPSFLRITVLYEYRHINRKITVKKPQEKTPEVFKASLSATNHFDIRAENVLSVLYLLSF
jgi:hypothetical protein